MDEAGPAHAVHTVNNFQNAQDNIWPHGPVQLARGRQAKDPNAKTVSYNVSSLDEFETSLREYLGSQPEDREHVDCQLSFWIGASFLVNVPAPVQNAQTTPSTQNGQQPQQHGHQQHSQHSQHSQHTQAPPGFAPAAVNSIHAQYGASSHQSHAFHAVSDPAIALTLPQFPPPTPNNANNGGNKKGKDDKVSMSILEALASTLDPKEKMRKQRAIAKCCIDAIQKVDGYRYSFHNCWNSREDDSFRFSYYCNDSLLNKDRAANGKGAKLGKRATKPVYDCRGVLAVKFSAVKQSLDVYYKHIPIHKTYEERAPPPRKDSKRRKLLEDTDPEALLRIATRPKPPKQPQDESADPNAQPKPKKKRKRDDDPQKQTAANSIESDLRAQSLRSLLELIQTDPNPEQAQEQAQQQPIANPSPNQNQNQNQNQGHQQARSPPLQPRPSHRPQPQSQVPQTQQAQPSQQTQTTQGRRRSQNSCDVCKTKKTKCDGVRPMCNTCRDKNRVCHYSTLPADDRRHSASNAPQSVRQPEPSTAVEVNDGLSELEKMKKELEEAKLRIQQLEAEKSRVATESQTPQPIQQAPPPPQPARQQSQSHPSQPQHQQQHHSQPQTPQYGHFSNHTSHPSYNMNRMHTQNSHQMQAQNSHQMQSSPTGFAPTPDSANPYRQNFNWPPNFYDPMSAAMHHTPQQQQQDQWGSARTSDMFR